MAQIHVCRTILEMHLMDDSSNQGNNQCRCPQAGKAVEHVFLQAHNLLRNLPANLQGPTTSHGDNIIGDHIANTLAIPMILRYRHITRALISATSVSPPGPGQHRRPERQLIDSAVPASLRQPHQPSY
jgi:hypothetical protein